MIKLWTWLRGKKSYAVALGAFLLAGAHYAHVFDDNTYQLLLGFLGAGGLAALRSAIGTQGTPPRP